MAAMLALNSDYLERAGVSSHSIVGLVGLSGPYALDPNSDTLRTIFAVPHTEDDWRPVHFPDRGHADTAASFTLVARYRTPALQQTLAFLGRVTAQNDARTVAINRRGIPGMAVRVPLTDSK